MKKMYKVKDVKVAFGNLEFLSFEEPVYEQSGSGRNARNKFVGNRYGLLSDSQDDVTVIIPGNVPKYPYEFKSKVDLVNPVLVAVGRMANRRAYIEWEIYADGIKVVNN